MWQVSARSSGGPRWGADGKWIYFWNGAFNVLSKVSISVTGPQLVFGTEIPFLNGSAYQGLSYDAAYSLSCDGRVLVNRVGGQSSRLTLVTNWMAN